MFLCFLCSLFLWFRFSNDMDIVDEFCRRIRIFTFNWPPKLTMTISTLHHCLKENGMILYIFITNIMWTAVYWNSCHSEFEEHAHYHKLVVRIFRSCLCGHRRSSIDWCSCTTCPSIVAIVYTSETHFWNYVFAETMLLVSCELSRMGSPQPSETSIHDV